MRWDHSRFGCCVKLHQGILGEYLVHEQRTILKLGISLSNCPLSQPPSGCNKKRLVFEARRSLTLALKLGGGDIVAISMFPSHNLVLDDVVSNRADGDS